MQPKIVIFLVILSSSSLAVSARSQLAQNGGADSRKWPWWPMCLFVEPGAGSLKELGESVVQQAAKVCKVNIVLTPYYVNQVSGSVDSLKQDAARTCEKRSGFKRLGAPSASVAVVTKNHNLPRTMCNGGADTMGCGEFSRDPGNVKDTLATVGKFGGIARAGSAAVSVIASGAPPYEIARWALGVGMMGLPPAGDASGMGVGSRDQYGGGGNLGSFGWTPAGCAEMRANAYTTRTPFAYADTYKISDDSRRPMSLVTAKFEGDGTVPRADAVGKPPTASEGSGATTSASDVRDPGIWNPNTKVQNTSGTTSAVPTETTPQAGFALDASGGHKLKPKAGNADGAAPDGMPTLTNTRNLDFSKTAGGKKTPGAIGSGTGGSSGTGSLMGGPGSGVGAAGGGMNVPPGAAGAAGTVGGTGQVVGGGIVKGADAGNPNFDPAFFNGKKGGEEDGLRRRTPSSRARGTIYGTGSGGDSGSGAEPEVAPEATAAD